MLEDPAPRKSGRLYNIGSGCFSNRNLQVTPCKNNVVSTPAKRSCGKSTPMKSTPDIDKNTPTSITALRSPICSRYSPTKRLMKRKLDDSLEEKMYESTSETASTSRNDLTLSPSNKMSKADSHVKRKFSPTKAVSSPRKRNWKENEHPNICSPPNKRLKLDFNNIPESSFSEQNGNDLPVLRTPNSRNILKSLDQNFSPTANLPNLFGSTADLHLHSPRPRSTSKKISVNWLDELRQRKYTPEASITSPKCQSEPGRGKRSNIRRKSTSNKRQSLSKKFNKL